ncbi:MAG: hypothetical protein ACREU2_00960 [Steroidobacteraceae bacterium]
MAEDSGNSAAARRLRYLATASVLRQWAVSAHSTDARREFMRLAELYEELAEYSAAPDIQRQGENSRPLKRDR